MNHYTSKFSGVPRKLTQWQMFGLHLLPKCDADCCRNLLANWTYISTTFETMAYTSLAPRPTCCWKVRWGPSLVIYATESKFETRKKRKCPFHTIRIRRPRPLLYVFIPVKRKMTSETTFDICNGRWKGKISFTLLALCAF